MRYGAYDVSSSVLLFFAIRNHLVRVDGANLTAACQKVSYMRDSDQSIGKLTWEFSSIVEPLSPVKVLICSVRMLAGCRYEMVNRSQGNYEFHRHDGAHRLIRSYTGFKSISIPVNVLVPITLVVSIIAKYRGLRSVNGVSAWSRYLRVQLR
jgi:hypothetical protein